VWHYPIPLSPLVRARLPGSRRRARITQERRRPAPPSSVSHFSVRLGSNLSCASPPPPSPVLQDRGSAATDHWNYRHHRNTAAITASSWTPPLSGEFPPPRPCSAPSPCAAHPPRQDLAVGRPPSRHRWPRRRNSHGRGDHAACVLAAAAAKVC
jgi:hypothetical protein